MPTLEILNNELESLLKEARTRATEAGLHGLPDGFLDTVAPALALAVVRQSGDEGVSLDVLRSRLVEIEGRRRRVEEIAGESQNEKRAPQTGGFRWRPELNAVALFGLAGLCLDLFSPGRLHFREWTALSLAGVLVAMNLRAVPGEIDRLCARLGAYRRYWIARRSARQLAREEDRLRAHIFQGEQSSSCIGQWMAHAQPLILAEYHLYRNRAVAAAQLES